MYVGERGMIWHRALSRISSGLSSGLSAGLSGGLVGLIAPAKAAAQGDVHLGQFVAPLGPNNAMAWNGRRSERLWQAMQAERERMGIDARAVVDEEIRRVRR